MKIKICRERNMCYPPDMMQKGNVSWCTRAKLEWVQISHMPCDLGQVARTPCASVVELNGNYLRTA